MADTKITALTAITTVDPAVDVFPIVDVSDTTMAASGTTKKITSNQLLGAGGTATLASASITGDLTVDTNTLKVDSANNRVGVGTASPAYLLDIADASFATRFVATNTNNSAFGAGVYLKTLNGASMVSNATLATSNDGTFNLLTGTSADSTKLSIGPTGIFTFQNVGGVAGTAMTLNSTGLGVGTSPATKLDVNGGTGGAGGQNHATFSGNAGRGLVIGTRSDSVSNDRTATLNAPFTGGSIVLQTQGTDRLLVDSSGNVGIGVTPSAWSATFRSLDIGSGALTSQPSQQSIGIYANAFENGTNYTRKALGFAAGYSIYNGAHYWLNAASGAAGSTFAFGSAVMTLDASGNLLVGVTSANASGGVLQLKSGITFPATQVASSDANTLDDYEEGTFTPIIQGSSSAGTGTYTTQSGRYTKIGRRVFVDIFLVWGAHTGTGNMEIGGLPYSVVSGSGYYPSITIGECYNIALTANNLMVGYSYNGATKIVLEQYPVGGGVQSSVPIDTSGVIACSISYDV